MANGDEKLKQRKKKHILKKKREVGERGGEKQRGGGREKQRGGGGGRERAREMKRARGRERKRERKKERKTECVVTIVNGKNEYAHAPPVAPA